MKRLLFPAFLAIGAGAGILVVAACDPDLGIVTVAGEGGGAAEGGASDAPVTPPVEGGGPRAEGGPDEAGAEAGTEHTIDGVNDFAPGEKLATSSPGYEAYVSWDDKKVYFGMSGADIGTTSSSKWVLIYVDGNPGNAGSTAGIGYDCGGSCTVQQPTLPFNAGYHLRWKLDGQYSNLQKWNGGAWADVGPISTFDRKGTFWEISLVRTVLGSPTKLKVSMNMLIEATGLEHTYAGVPGTTFAGNTPADGPDRDHAKFYEFDLADRAKAPNTYTPKP